MASLKKDVCADAAILRSSPQAARLAGALWDSLATLAVVLTIREA